jgi:hypothetical protein
LRIARTWRKSHLPSFMVQGTVLMGADASRSCQWVETDKDWSICIL